MKFFLKRNSRIHRYVLLLPILTVILVLTGCWDRIEVNDLAIVSAIGLDAGEGNTIVISAQVFLPEQSGGGEIPGMSSGKNSAQPPHSFVASAAGMNMADATSKLQEKLPRQIFWGHAKVIIFGEKLSRRAVLEPVEYLVRHPGPRERALIFVCKGKASDNLSVHPVIERDTAEMLREMAVTKTGLIVTLALLEQYIASNEAFALPYVQLYKPAAPKLETPYIKGSAIFKQHKMIGRIDDKQTRGIMWLTGQIDAAPVTTTFTESGGTVSIDIYRVKSKLIPSIRGDQWSITYQAQAEGNVIENTSQLDMMDEKQMKHVEQRAAEAIEERIQSMLAQVQKKYSADALGFGHAFRSKYPQQWKKDKSNWKTIFPQLEVKLEVDVNVQRGGFTNQKLTKTKPS